MNNKTHILINRPKPKRRILKVMILTVLIALLGIGVWLGVTFYQTIKKVTSFSSDKSLFSIFGKDQQALKGQSDGRTNILLLGMGGKNHPGGMLADTIIVLSIDWKENKIAMISVPRDLWVKVPGLGYSKINGAFSYGEQNSQKTGGGGQVTSETISQVFDMPIHYFVSVDFDGFKKLVDTLGGIDINVEKDLYDPYYPAPNMIDYDPFKITAGQHHMDGATALKYARSRETTSDFDRAHRQQQVIKAIQEKAMSLDILGNPKKLVDLMNVVGDHVRTNLSPAEIKTLSEAQKNLDRENMISKVFDTAADGPLTSTQDERGYIIIPKKGVGNYIDLQKIVKNIFTPEDQAKPEAVQGTQINKTLKIEVLNGSGKVGAAKKIADKLVKEGYRVIKIGDATGISSQSVVYNCGGNSTSGTVVTIAHELDFQLGSLATCSGSDIRVLVGSGSAN